ncbi:MAG: hypothetical protein V5804_16775 [Mucilaginibacter sp.]|uniref:hypothetical protein n=1 Tax=Mucilaginibacter sp. TaxID=1882438 RepID=UPI0034E56B27
MENEAENNNQQNHESQFQPSNVPECEIENNITQVTSNSTNGANGSDIINESANIRANTVNQWDIKTSEVIAIAAVSVNIVLAIFTYFLFEKASAQTKAAIISANAAIKADSIAEQSYTLSNNIFKSSDSANKVSFNETKRLNDNIIIENRKRSKRDSLSLNAQLQTLTASQKEFEVGNEPYLQIVKPSFSIANNKHIVIQYSIENLGNYPIKVLVNHPGVSMDFNPNFLALNEYMFKNTKIVPKENIVINRYITKDKPFDFGVIIDRPITDKLENVLKDEKSFLVIEGFIIYQNLVTKNKKIYKYMFSVNINGVTYTKINENINM